MKKSIIFGAGLYAALVLTSCGTNKEMAYRKAYEKAQAQEQPTTVQPETKVVAPVVTQSTAETKVVDNYDNVPVRSEHVAVVNGNGLKAFSVVVGSFSLKANAESLQSRLTQSGCSAQLVQNPETQMYRVVAATFDTKPEAAQSRDQFRSTYPDAWLLYAK